PTLYLLSRTAFEQHVHHGLDQAAHSSRRLIGGPARSERVEAVRPADHPGSQRTGRAAEFRVLAPVAVEFAIGFEPADRFEFVLGQRALQGAHDGQQRAATPAVAEEARSATGGCVHGVRRAGTGIAETHIALTHIAEPRRTGPPCTKAGIAGFGVIAVVTRHRAPLS